MSYLNKDTKQQHISEADIRAEFPYTMFGDPFIPPEKFSWVFPTPMPEYDPLTQYVIEGDAVLTEKGHYEQTWKILSLSPEVIAINTDPEVKAASDTLIISNKVQQLWEAADQYVTGYISGVAIGILTIGVMQQKPKSVAVSNWSNLIWSEYYTRKEAITVDNVLDLDFSSFGPIPYTIPELKEEVFS